MIDEEILLDSKVAMPSEGSSVFLVNYLPATLLLALISIAVSTADTWASEIGQYFKQTTYDLIRLKRVEPGLSGGVSISGTLAALIGSALIASLGFLFSSFYGWPDFLLVTAAGFIGMLIDSILGSSLQRQYYDSTHWSDTPMEKVTKIRGIRWISNDVVNVLANAATVLLFLLFV
jgi:uncharacterized membrane protein